MFSRVFANYGARVGAISKYKNAELRGLNDRFRFDPFSTSILCVSKQTYRESVDVLYKYNIFILTPAEITNFGNTENFSRIKRIVVQNDEGSLFRAHLGPKGMGVALRNALFDICTRAHRTLELETLEIPVDTCDSLLRAIEAGHATAIDIGTWTVSVGQPFDIVYVHEHLRALWKDSKEAAEVPRGENTPTIPCNTVTESALLTAARAIDQEAWFASAQQITALTWTIYYARQDLAQKRQGGAWDFKLLQLGRGSEAEHLHWANDFLLNVLWSLEDHEI